MTKGSLIWQLPSVQKVYVLIMTEQEKNSTVETDKYYEATNCTGSLEIFRILEQKTSQNYQQYYEKLKMQEGKT